MNTRAAETLEYTETFSDLPDDVAFAAGVAALAGDVRSVLIRFAMGAAVFLVGHTGTGGVSAFLLVSHIVFISLGLPAGQSWSFDAHYVTAGLVLVRLFLATRRSRRWHLL